MYHQRELLPRRVRRALEFLRDTTMAQRHSGLLIRRLVCRMHFLGMGFDPAPDMNINGEARSDTLPVFFGVGFAGYHDDAIRPNTTAATAQMM